MKTRRTTGRGVNAVSRRRRRRPGINGVPAVISRSGARARAHRRVRSAQEKRRVDRASRPRVRVHGAPSSRGTIIRDRRVVVVYSRGEARETRKTGVVHRLDSTPRPARSRARACDGEERNENKKREERGYRSLSLSSTSSLPVIALEGTPERRRPSSYESANSLSTRRPQSRRDHPLNLSILLSGGKETNQDFLSSGERTGRSPAPNPAVPPQGNVVFGRVRLSRGVASRPSPS